MPSPTRKLEYLPLDDVRGAEQNPKGHDEVGLAASLERFGFTEPPLLDERTGRLVVGHGRLDALRARRDRGEAPPDGVVVKTGAWLVPVQRGWSSVDDSEAAAYLLASNQLTTAGGWTDDLGPMLDDLVAAGVSLDGLGWSDDELAGLLTSSPPSGPADDTFDEPPAEPVTVLGDLWEVGPHRLICGDCTGPGVLDRLMDGAEAGCLLTDPPYGMNLDTDYSQMGAGNKPMLQNHPGGTYRPVAGDDVPFDPTPVRTFFAATSEQFWFGADYYRRLLSDDDRDGSWLVWDKRNEASDAGFGSGFEMVWSATPHKRDLLRYYFFGAFGAEGANRVHPTQKPTPMLSAILTRWAPDGCVVADPYAGSGSILLAAAMTDRAGYGIELDPAYCDVTLTRLQRRTGDKPTRDGEPHDFTAAD